MTWFTDLVWHKARERHNANKATCSCNLNHLRMYVKIRMLTGYIGISNTHLSKWFFHVHPKTSWKIDPLHHLPYTQQYEKTTPKSHLPYEAPRTFSSSMAGPLSTSFRLSPFPTLTTSSSNPVFGIWHAEEWMKWHANKYNKQPHKTGKTDGLKSVNEKPWTWHNDKICLVMTLQSSKKKQ